MAKTRNLPAVTEAAKRAGLQLSTFAAVEAEAANHLRAAENKQAGQNFAEFLLSGNGSRAIVKIGDSVFKIEG